MTYKYQIQTCVHKIDKILALRITYIMKTLMSDHLVGLPTACNHLLFSWWYIQNVCRLSVITLHLDKPATLTAHLGLKKVVHIRRSAIDWVVMTVVTCHLVTW